MKNNPRVPANPYACLETPGTSTALKYLMLYVTRPGASKRTTISLTPAQHAELLCYCYGSAGMLSAEARLAAHDIPADTPRMRFSKELRALLLLRLRAGYRPAVEAARRLAAENNAAWSSAG